MISHHLGYIQNEIVCVTHELSLQIRGEAEAYAVEAKGRAEAEQMAKKAEAFQHYKEGAMVDMLLEKLPLVRWCICNCKNRNLVRDNPA